MKKILMKYRYNEGEKAPLQPHVGTLDLVSLIGRASSQMTLLRDAYPMTCTFSTLLESNAFFAGNSPVLHGK